MTRDILPTVKHSTRVEYHDAPDLSNPRAETPIRTWDVLITVNLDRILNQLGTKASRSANGQASACYGAVVIRATLAKRDST